MANVAITPTTLAINTRSADILDANGVAISNAADNTFVIAAGGRAGDHILLKFLDDGTSDTIVIKAGDRPPSQRVDIGDLSLSMTASDCRYIVVETGRFLQDDGSIHATCGVNGTTCKAFILPNQ